MDLSVGSDDLERRWQTFLFYFCITLVPFDLSITFGPSIPKFLGPLVGAYAWRSAINFGMVTHVGEERVWRSAVPPLQGAGPQRPPIFGTPIYIPTICQYRNTWVASLQGFSHANRIKGVRRPSVPIATRANKAWEAATKFCMVIKLHMRKCFTW